MENQNGTNRLCIECSRRWSEARWVTPACVLSWGNWVWKFFLLVLILHLIFQPICRLFSKWSGRKPKLVLSMKIYMLMLLLSLMIFNCLVLTKVQTIHYTISVECLLSSIFCHIIWYLLPPHPSQVRRKYYLGCWKVWTMRQLMITLLCVKSVWVMFVRKNIDQLD